MAVAIDAIDHFVMDRSQAAPLELPVSRDGRVAITVLGIATDRTA